MLPISIPDWKRANGVFSKIPLSFLLKVNVLIKEKEKWGTRSPMRTLHIRERVSSCKVLIFTGNYYISYRTCNHLRGQKLLFINVTVIKWNASACRDTVWPKEACKEPIIGALLLKGARKSMLLAGDSGCRVYSWFSWTWKCLTKAVLCPLVQQLPGCVT